MNIFRVLMVIILSLINSAYASLLNEETKPAEISSNEVKSLINTLENDQSRQTLIHNLKVLIKAGQPQDSTNHDLQQANFLISEFLHNCGTVLTNWKDHLWVMVKVFKPTTVQHMMVEFLWIGVLVLAFAGGAEWCFLKLFTKMSASMRTRAQQGLLSKGQIFIIRIAVYLLALLVFSLTAFIAAYWLAPQSRVQQLIVFTIGLTIVLKAGQRISQITLSPAFTALRLIPLKDTTAQELYRFLCIIGSSIGIAYGLTSLLHILNAPREAIFFMARISTLTVGGLLIASIGRFKAPINHWLSHEKLVEGKHDKGINRFIVELGRSWYPMLISYIVIMMGVMFSSDIGRYQEHIGLLIHTSAVIVIAYLLILTLPKVVKLALKQIADKHPLIKPRLRTYRRIFSAILLLLVVIGTVMYCANLWKISFVSDFMESRNHTIVLQFFSLTFILLIGIMAWEINELLVERKFNQSKTKDNQPISPEALKRLKTLQPLIRNTVRGFILLFITLMFFSELGLNIAPLLAGASVFGIALSLGGQTLVKDIITGSFILIEDTMNMGDYVELSGHSGRIESMSLRTVTLRDSYGGVHSIPFSSINTIVNLSKSFSVCIFNFTIDHSVDIKTVEATLKEVDQTMREDPQWSGVLIAPLEVLGVTAFDGGSYTLRVQLRVAPGKQWLVEREINWRFAKAFEKDGIKFPTNKQWIVIEQAAL